MDKIKSLDDLRKMKQQVDDGLVQIKVAMATCSIASGARDHGGLSRQNRERKLERHSKPNRLYGLLPCRTYC